MTGYCSLKCLLGPPHAWTQGIMSYRHVQGMGMSDLHDQPCEAGFSDAFPFRPLQEGSKPVLCNSVQFWRDHTCYTARN